MVLQTHAKFVLALLGSSVVALVVTFILAAVSISGVTSISAAEVFLWIAIGIFWLAILATGVLYCPSLSGAKSGLLAIVLLLAAYGGWWGRSHLSLWLFQEKTRQEAHEPPPAKQDAPVPPITSKSSPQEPRITIKRRQQTSPQVSQQTGPPKSAVNQTPTVVSAPNGIAIGGGTVTSPTVNNFRNPLPEIEISESIKLPAKPRPQPTPGMPIFEMPGTTHNPGAEVIVSVKSVFYNPAFVADCSVPCTLVAIYELGNGVERMSNLDFKAIEGANNMAAGATYAQTMYPGLRLKLIFESLDDRDLTVFNVRPYAP